MQSLFALLVTLVVASLPLHAVAADIKVLTAGAYKPIVLALAPAFEKQTGHKLVVVNDTAGGLERRIAGGEAFDVVVMPPAGLERLTKAARVTADSQAPLARVAIGVAVKRGAAVPDIGTVAALQQALLAARAVAYIDPAAGGSSGIYLSQLFERWGLAAQIKAKAVLVPGGLVAERLVSGEADLALHQISEILAVPGAQLVGPIPKEIQNYTDYSGAVSASTAEPVAARALLVALRADSAREVLKDKGMEAP
ncbi:MAG: substrate-binding domain-containing protein [Pseudomonadota bacterium]